MRNVQSKTGSTEKRRGFLERTIVEPAAIRRDRSVIRAARASGTGAEPYPGMQGRCRDGAASTSTAGRDARANLALGPRGRAAPLLLQLADKILQRIGQQC